FESYGPLSLDWNMGRVNVWGVTINYQMSKGYPILYTKEMNTSPTYVPCWQVSKIQGNDTFLMINNLGTKTLLPKINIYDHIGNILGVAAPTIKAGGVGVIPLSDYVNKSEEFGSATVTWTGSSPVKLWGTIFNLNERSGQVLQLNNNVNSQSPVNVPYFMNNNNSETYLLISNMGDKVTLPVSEFFDTNGTSFGLYSLGVLSPHATVVLRSSEATQFTEGRAKITWGSGNVAVWGTIYNSATNTFTTLTLDTPKGSE
ncbi:hypothetical protein KKB18_03400, partial [bacterium]|nr:hypothetical protein [bacterium]